MRHYDAIVVGVGGMGSATVYQLERRRIDAGVGTVRHPPRSRLIPRHKPNHRLAYWEHPSYVPLQRRVPHEVLSAGELHRRYPGYRLPEDMVGLYQPDGGFVLSERAIVAYVMAAQALGAEVRAREPVLEWEPDGGGIQVRTSRDVYVADRLVTTAGPWAARLVPSLARAAVPERQVLLWAQPLRPEYFRLGAFPVFNMKGRKGDFTGFRSTAFPDSSSASITIAGSRLIPTGWTERSMPRTKRCCARGSGATSLMRTAPRWR